MRSRCKKKKSLSKLKNKKLNLKISKDIHSCQNEDCNFTASTKIAIKKHLKTTHSLTYIEVIMLSFLLFCFWHNRKAGQVLLYITVNFKNIIINPENPMGAKVHQ